MKNGDTSEKIEKIFLSTFPGMSEKEFSLDKKQAEFENWDSFAHMELVSKIEQELGVTLDFEEIAEIDSPRKFVEVVQKKLS